MNTQRIYECMCTPCSEYDRKWCAQMCTLMSKHVFNLNTCTCIGAQKHLFNACHTLCKRCTCTRACALTKRCRNHSAMKTIANYFESCASFLHFFCRKSRCCLDEIGRPTLLARENRPIPRQLMTLSPLWRRTSIIHLSRWRGPHSDGLCFALARGRKAHSRQKSISTINFAKRKEQLEEAAYISSTWAVLQSLQYINSATRMKGEAAMSALGPPFFQSAGQKDLILWGEK